MSSLSFDHQSYSPELAKEGLQVTSIASTHQDGSSVLISPDLDPATNPDLQQALRIYSRHYLASQNGIPGEGEDLDVVLSRLRGEDDNVKRVSIVGLKNDTGKVVGAAFIESYEVDKAPERNSEGQPTNGLVHLITYAAVEEPYEKTLVNTGFHAGIMNEILKIDKELGYEGNSIIATEVNGELGYNGERQSDKMAPEFEVKTGAPRELRAAYIHGGGDHLLPLAGKHNTSHALGVRFTPPNLGGEEDVRIPEAADTPSDLAPFLRNNHALDGELLFLTAESPYHQGINAHDAALHEAFQQAFNVSVAQGNHGLEDKSLIRAALKDPSNKEYNAMMEDYSAVIAAAAAKGKSERGAPPTIIRTDDAQMQDIEREQKRQTGK